MERFSGPLCLVFSLANAVIYVTGDQLWINEAACLFCLAVGLWLIWGRAARR